jgi:hypothetical protein
MTTHSTEGKLLTIHVTGSLETWRGIDTIVSPDAFYMHFELTAKASNPVFDASSSLRSLVSWKVG